MKIALISPNTANQQDISRLLEAESHSVLLVQGSADRMRAIAEQEQPDLILVDSLFGEADDLGPVEYVTSTFPHIAVILLCQVQTPDFLLSAMRAGVREVLLAPVVAGALETAVRRVAAKRAGGQARAPGKILAFMSCKGGSGATFLATNLGYQLAEARSVLLIDLNLQFGDALSFVSDATPASTLASVTRDIRRLDASFLSACTVKVAPNYSLLAAPEDLSQASEVKPEHIEAILNLAEKEYDFILLDIGRSIDPLSIRALDRAYRIFPVLQASLPYIRNAKKMLEAFTALGYSAERLDLIVNRFDKRGDIGLDDIRRLLGRSHLRTVPNSYRQVNASINQGNPLVTMARSNAVSRILFELTQALSPRPAEERSILGRLFGRP